MKREFLIISLSASLALGNIADSNFSYQDYMDFGQNKGRFQPGATGLYLVEKGTGKKYYLNAPMPDFVGWTGRDANMVFVGGSYMFTAWHTNYPRMDSIETDYHKVAEASGNLSNGDWAIIRYNKLFT